MELIRLRSESIGSLALFALCFFVTMYLLSIYKKSRDGWRITVLFILLALDYLAGFIANSFTGIWYDNILVLQDSLVSIVIIYEVWFIYSYRQNLFAKETRAVLLLLVLLYVLALYFEQAAYLWTSFLSL